MKIIGIPHTPATENPSLLPAPFIMPIPFLVMTSISRHARPRPPFLSRNRPESVRLLKFGCSRCPEKWGTGNEKWGFLFLVSVKMGHRERLVISQRRIPEVRRPFHMIRRRHGQFGRDLQRT